MTRAWTLDYTFIEPHLDAAPDDWHGICGALKAEIAYVHARRGRYGEGWAHLERADAIAQRLGRDYRHVQTSFSIPVLAAHATTLGVELRRPGEALRAGTPWIRKRSCRCRAGAGT